MASGSSYVKGPVKVPITPKANKILILKLVPTEAELKIQCDVTPWNYKQNEIIFQ
jgi:hypothetical protein